ncbi:L,D-transpeptidase family protein [Devosia sp. XJ19-1]|uniref:L,D-transpeptidase family protein n=1 Tax=Devosia ureilytica TaxID=2952754 RepID=A0A9Q4AR46_9HYPH|nr:L,D-transpeptidase family protein [Devosia ureilytica]MCP8884728.1 L,D-transpeptidase family protein [Devosia ureilytica]MCP8888359.1 L,D-transpeptidase family protein [Devosia ureilytica]
MNKVLVSLVALIAATASVPAVFAQQVASLETSRIVIAPPQTELARTIKSGLSAAYYGARPETAAHAEAQRLYFLYGERHFEPIWLTENGKGEIAFSPAANKIIDLFRNAASEGLVPADYLTPSISMDKLTGDGIALATLETAFSAATMRYANHLHNGRIKPQSISPLLDIQPKPIDEAALLEQLAGSNDPAAILATLEPQHPEFRALKAALANFEQSSAKRPTPIGEGPVLRPGNSDARLPAIRERLELTASTSSLYDALTVDAIKSFQEVQGLEIDGIIGPATVAALNGGAATRREDILANMERWRWMPSELGDFTVFVNIPEFRLAILRNGVEEYTTRVVVGTTKNQTPIFSDNIRHVVVNPYWNVPSSIIRGEIAPAVLSNPGYTDSHNMDLLYNGSPVSPWQVDWSQVSTSNFPFRVRQRPGAGNALGQIKFLFPNKHDVYLHDTPSKSLFGRSYRAFSHGCVRVQNPMEFADALMANEPNISRASLEAMFGSSERWVNPEKQIPVHIAYFTLRANPDGTLRAYGDVYGHNEKLIAAMGLVTAEEPAIVAEAENVPEELSP